MSYCVLSASIETMSAFTCSLPLGFWCHEKLLHAQENFSFKDVDLVQLAQQGDFHTGLAAAVCVTVMSELGDKSFLMSAILAMHHSRTMTFFGSILGQVVMTAVAVGLGMVASLVPQVYTKWASCICMTFFGVKMLKDGFNMPLESDSSYDQNDNFKELDEEICKKNIEGKKISEDINTSKDTNGKLQIYEVSAKNNKKEEINISKPNSKQGSRRNSSEGVLVQAFTLSFLGEWGDRSQIATIVLASNENPYGVAVGSMLGHIVCSLLAVVGGRLIGQRFPVKTMTQAGGVVFLLCAASALVFE